MEDFFMSLKAQTSFVLSVVGGVIVSILTSDSPSVIQTLTRVFAGITCAILFTDATIDYFGRDPDVYRNAVGGIWAMSGYMLSRIFVNLKKTDVIHIIEAIRGKKK